MAGGGRAGRGGVRRGRLRGRGNHGIGREPDPRPGGRHGGDPRGASRGARLLRGGASPVHRDGLRVRGACRLGALPGVQRRPTRGRGARELQVGHAQGHRAIRRPQGPRQQHHPHRQRAHPPREPQVRPLHRHQRQRARGGRTRHRQDALLRQAEPPAGQRQLLRYRPEGHAHTRDGRRAGGARLRDPRVRHHRLLALHALQPHSLHTRRGGRHPLRPRHRRQHRGRGRPQGRPLLGEGRATGLHRPHCLPRHALRARRQEPRRAAHAALPRRRPRRPGLHEPARHGVPRAGDRRAPTGRCAASPRRTAHGSGSRSASPRRPTTSRSRATASSASPPATP